MYLFIYSLVIMTTAAVSSAGVLKQTGRDEDIIDKKNIYIIKKGMRENTEEKKGRRGQRTLHNAGQEMSAWVI